MRKSSRTRGFTLLEVVIALAILGVALMGIFDLNAGAIASHGYSKRLTVASLLAKAKMTDLEQQLYDDGLPPDDDEESGDFSDEGWPNYKWRAKILAPQTDQVSPDQLIGALFNLPTDMMGEGGIAGMLGGGAAAAAAGGAGADPMAGLAALGPMGAMAQTQFTQMLEQVGQSVREVHLTVSWKDGDQVDSIDLVTHMVTLGPGSDRNGNTTGQAGAGQGATSGWVNAQTGAPVQESNVVQGPNGKMVDRTTNQEVIREDDWNTRRGGAAGAAGAPGGALNRGMLNPLNNLRNNGFRGIGSGQMRPPPRGLSK